MTDFANIDYSLTTIKEYQGLTLQGYSFIMGLDIQTIQFITLEDGFEEPLIDEVNITIEGINWLPAHRNIELLIEAHNMEGEIMEHYNGLIDSMVF